MKILIFVGLAALCVGSAIAVDPHEHNKVVCFWNSTSFNRQELGKFRLEDLHQALPYCTHLVYGYAGINAANNEAISLHPELDTGAGRSLYKLTTQLKNSYPGLKVYLSIGGNADPYEDTHKYLTVTETPEARRSFIKSAVDLCTSYGFDGIDLAWQFPTIKAPKQQGSIVKFWHKIKKTFGYGKFKDEKENEHRDGFTALVRDLNNELRTRNLALTLTILPHVNVSVYYDANVLTRHIDAVHLMAFDQSTPERNSELADYPAPIYEIYNRPSYANVNSAVRYWLEHGTPGGKIVVGIPTYGRTWRLNSDSAISGVPEIVAKGPGPAGPLTETPGILSYGEVCSRLVEKAVGQVRRVGDPTKKYGSYAYLSYNSDTEADGIWIGYEDPDTAGNKATYAKSKGLGGIAVFDLSTDDFRGTCTSDKFPIVRSVKLKL